jgi:hypothetical protein
MEVYRAQVLDNRYYHERSGIFRFPGRITAAAVLKLAGVKSRSTLRSAYHEELQEELAKFIRDLKQRTGRGRRRNVQITAAGYAESFVDRTERMAQAIAALEYEIMARRATDRDASTPEPCHVQGPCKARDRRRTVPPSRRR